MAQPEDNAQKRAKWIKDRSEERREEAAEAEVVAWVTLSTRGEATGFNGWVATDGFQAPCMSSAKAVARGVEVIESKVTLGSS